MQCIEQVLLTKFNAAVVPLITAHKGRGGPLGIVSLPNPISPSSMANGLGEWEL